MVVVDVRAWLVGLLWGIKDLSIRVAETIALFEGSILDLEGISQGIVGGRWATFKLLKALALREADWDDAVPHGVRGLLITYETEQLRSIL